MNKFKFTIRGNQYDVEIEKIEDNIATIEVNGSRYEVEIEREEKKTKTPTILRQSIKPEVKNVEKKEGGSAVTITAPLPGTIMTVLVKEGDIIKKNQPLIIMEAMKMENNVLAEKDGVVEKIHVKPADNVLQGDKLVDIV